MSPVEPRTLNRIANPEKADNSRFDGALVDDAACLSIPCVVAGEAVGLEL
jgi:hypothetical protein